jgi:hypothetical protein
VGAVSEKDIPMSRDAEDCSACEVMIDVFGSSEWSVWVCDPAVMEKLSSIY